MFYKHHMKHNKEICIYAVLITCAFMRGIAYGMCLGRKLY
jgi:hypothetical protein